MILSVDSKKVTCHSIFFVGDSFLGKGNGKEP